MKEPDNALEFATEAVRYWPERWHFHKRLIELLITLERFDEAREALTYARSQDKSATHTAEADSFARNITSALRAKDGVRR